MSVLDASAILALLQKEPGSAQVATHLADSVVSAVNAAEIATKLADVGLPDGFAPAVIKALGVTIVDFDARQAWAVASLRESTRELGLSLGDRACLALGLSSAGPTVTADRSWAGLPDEFNVLVVR